MKSYGYGGWLVLMCANIAYGAPPSHAVTTSGCASRVPHNPFERAAQIACAEHQLWHAPWINHAGQLMNIGPMEAERDRLTDGTPAWQRVRYYWRNSVGESDLFRGQTFSDSPSDERVRSQIIDTPWSGVFISYVMKAAGVDETRFHLADGHIRYIKPALDATSDYGYTAHNPYASRMRVGDLLCYVRDEKKIWGHTDLMGWLRAHAQDNASLRTHCDIVVGISPRYVYTIGGNVVQSVTMRQLRRTRWGALHSQYARRTTNTPLCQPYRLTTCSLNRQDWGLLLRYRHG